MASVGHVVVGMATARLFERRPIDGGAARADTRPRWPALIAWSALSLLPDADVVGFSIGVHYEDPWGHRGATHSILFAIVVGLAVGVVARGFRRPMGRTALFATGVLATHGLLDALTDGGLGVAFFYPVNLTRYFAFWRPIQVAPIGLDFFTPFGAMIAASESVLFFPLLVYAVFGVTWRRRPRFHLLVGVLWLVASWLIASGDPLRERVVAWVLRDTTEYAAGFSEGMFARLSEGQRLTDVRDRLGVPLDESWMWVPDTVELANARANEPGQCRAIRFESGLVLEMFEADACRSHGIRDGQSMRDVEQILGAPADQCWAFTRARRPGPFRLRLVCFHGDRVEMVARRWIF